MMREKRVIYTDQLRSLCIAKGWYTCGNCAEYSRMLDMCGDGVYIITTDAIVAIASDIMKHSKDEGRTLESYCFDIAEIAHTFFEECESDTYSTELDFYKRKFKEYMSDIDKQENEIESLSIEIDRLKRENEDLQTQLSGDLMGTTR